MENSGSPASISPPGGRSPCSWCVPVGSAPHSLGWLGHFAPLGTHRAFPGASFAGAPGSFVRDSGSHNRPLPSPSCIAEEGDSGPCALARAAAWGAPFTERWRHDSVCVRLFYQSTCPPRGCCMFAAAPMLTLVVRVASHAEIPEAYLATVHGHATPSCLRVVVGCQRDA